MLLLFFFFFRAGELEAARQHGARRKRLLCPSQGAGEGKSRKTKQPGCCSPVPQRHLQAPRRQTRVFGPGVAGVLLALPGIEVRFLPMLMPHEGSVRSLLPVQCQKNPKSCPCIGQAGSRG